jgi:hypothetical protein
MGKPLSRVDAMRDYPAILAYSANEKRRIAPSRSDGYIALFTVIAVIAGLTGVLGIPPIIVAWAKPEWVGETERPPWSFLVLVLGFHGAALALAFVAGRLAWRRARPAE